jgi:UDP:flavonoid glycosyltransferase YjiC (YdhE family)
VRPLTFVLASTPITAHTINVAPIAARLVERGHRVLWYAASRFHAQVAAAGAEPYAFGEAREFDDLAAAYGGAGSLRAIAGLRQGFAEQLVGDAARRVRDLEALSDGAGVDAVLVDAMFVAARLWHERGGPVWASLGDGPLTYADVDTPPYGAGLLPMAGREGRRRNRVTTRVADQLIWSRALERLGALRCELGLVQSGRSVLAEARSPYLHLQACEPSFEYPREGLPAEVRFVGALRPSRPPAWEPPAWWSDFLADRRPAVLISQGTLRPDLRELVLPTIEALEGIGVQAVVTTGAAAVGELRSRLGGVIPPWVRQAPWIPYEQVLPHVEVFVTNGGYTGVTLALAHGVPLVQVGSTEEKAETGARIVWSGVGVRSRWLPSRRRLRAMVRRVLTDPVYRGAAQRMGREAAGHDAAGQCVDLLEQLAVSRASIG